MRVQTTLSNDREMSASAIIRVFCVDGPCEGVQYMDEATGRILFEKSQQWHVYRLDGATTNAVHGPCPAA